MTFTIDDVLSRLERVERCGAAWKALCPAHADQQPSLSIGLGDNGGVLLFCHAGCRFESIVAALGLNRHPQPENRPKNGKRLIIATYDYHDAQGQRLYQKVRYAPKDFRIRQPDGQGGWIWKRGSAPPVLYRLPALCQAIAEGKPVFVVEGEKDVDRLYQARLTATTNIEGAAQPHQRAKWRPEYTEQLAGAHQVILLPDNDACGKAHMRTVAMALTSQVAVIRWLELPGLPEKGDVSDWLDAGHTVPELLALAEAAPLALAGTQHSKTAAKAKPPAIDSVFSEGTQPIYCIPGNLHRVIVEAEEALLRANVSLYQRGGQLVTPIILPIDARTDTAFIPAGSLLIDPISKPWLRLNMTESAPWYRYDERKKDYVRTDCPLKYAETYFVLRGKWRVPVLTGVVQCPTLRRDGTLLTEPGYDPTSGLYLNYDGSPVTVPDHPTWEGALVAIRILQEPFSEFPFVDAVDVSVLLSGILTAVARRAFPTAPFHAFDAPAAGSGKGLLVDSIALIVTGRPASLINQADDPAEGEKRLGAMLLKGVSILNIDNIQHLVEGDFLCSLATQEIVDHRPLGVSNTVSIVTNTVTLFMTGNNIVFKGDMTRRALICRIDPRCEHPDTRTFKRNLKEYLLAHRHELLSAALTILRAYHVAGRPKHGNAPYGSFEYWDALIRGALLWLGEPDPLESRNRIETVDPEKSRFKRLLTAWVAVFGSESVTVSALIKAATAGVGDGSFGHEAKEELYQALLDVAGRGETINSRTLAWFLRKHCDGVVSNYRLSQVGGYSTRTLWCVTFAVSAISAVIPTQRGKTVSVDKNKVNSDKNDSFI